MKIILNADDFGFSEDTVEATIRCLEGGKLTGATIMANMPCTEKALAYARRHPEFSWGVHLTFSSDGQEYPLTDPELIPDLVQGNGQFLPTNSVRIRALCNRLPPKQIEMELAAQIQRLIDAGIPVSHVDSHCHLHKFGPFRKALESVLPRFNLCRVRNVQDVYLRRPLGSPTFWLGPWWRQRTMKHFRTTSHLFMPTSAWEHDWSEALLKRLRAGSIEVGVHPGSMETWRRSELVQVGIFADLARKAGHDIIGWRAL